MSFKKTLALCLSLLILAGCAVTGTLAFPNFLSKILPAAEETERETPTPKVDIELEIAKTADGVLMYPGRPFPKKVTITNTAASTEKVYVWYTYTVPKALVQPADPRITGQPLTGTFNATNWLNNWKVDVGETEIEYTCLYTLPLAPDTSIQASLESVTLDVHIDREPDGTFVWWENGVCIPVGYKGNEVRIPFKAYAISTTEFNGVEAAYNGYYSNQNDTTTAEASAE